MHTDRHGLLTIGAGLLLGAMAASAADKPLSAFPGAEGYGCDTPGGRGGKVIHVTNLKPDGPGSLQAACAARGRRIVVFDVSGVIPNTITLEHSNITIAGQTAPGAGITIEGMLVAKPGIRDIVVRFVRVRPRPVDEVIRPKEEGGGPLAVRLSKIGVRLIPPDEGPFDEYDAIKLSRTSNVVLDHVSMSWSVDEAIDMCYTHHATIQWCTIEEAAKGHTKYGGLHNFGPLAAYRKTYSTFHHNLFANLSRRCPAVREGPSDIRNNVVYNFQHGISHDMNAVGAFNIVGNTFRRGPNSGTTVKGARWTGPRVNPILTTKNGRYYVRDNHFDGKEVGAGAGRKLERPAGTPPVTTHTAGEAYGLVLKRAGAFPRDAVTRRTIEEVRTGKGDWGRREPEGGLMAGLKAGKAPLDADKDGMADQWEKKRGLDPAKDDSAKVLEGGYTAIEVYLDELAKALVATQGLHGSTAGAVAAPVESKAPASRREAIKRAIARIDAELKAYGNGTWEGWAKSLKPFRESLKANRPPTRGFRFSREGKAMLLADRLQDTPVAAKAFDAIVHATREFRKIGIDLLVVFIPNKMATYPDYAADHTPKHRMVMLAEKRFMRDLLERDVEVVDLYTAYRDFRQAKGDDAPLFYGHNDIHWRNAAAQVAAEEIAKHVNRYRFVQEAVAQPKRYEVRPGRREGGKADNVGYVYKVQGGTPYTDVYDSPIMLTGDSYSRYNWSPDKEARQGHFAAQLAARINLPVTYIASSGLWDDMPEMVSGIDLGTAKKYAGHAGLLKPCRVIVWTFISRALVSNRPWNPFDLPQAAGK